MLVLLELDEATFNLRGPWMAPGAIAACRSPHEYDPDHRNREGLPLASRAAVCAHGSCGNARLRGRLPTRRHASGPCCRRRTDPSHRNIRGTMPPGGWMDSAKFA